VDAPDAAEPELDPDVDLDADSFRVETPEPGRLAVHGEVDAATAARLDAALRDTAAAKGGDVVLDCTELTFIDSSGLSVLVGNHQRLSSQSRTLVILSPPPAAIRLFEIAGLDRVLTIR
jgi:anti-sigma B factor antagonist